MRLRLVLLNVCLLALLTPGATAIAQTPDPTFNSDIEKLLNYTGAANLSTQLATLMTRAIMQQSKVPEGPAAPSYRRRAINCSQPCQRSEWTRGRAWCPCMRSISPR